MIYFFERLKLKLKTFQNSTCIISLLLTFSFVKSISFEEISLSRSLPKLGKTNIFWKSHYSFPAPFLLSFLDSILFLSPVASCLFVSSIFLSLSLTFSPSFCFSPFFSLSLNLCFTLFLSFFLFLSYFLSFPLSLTFSLALFLCTFLHSLSFPISLLLRLRGTNTKFILNN